MNNETRVKFEHVYGLKYVQKSLLITQSCFETMVFYFTVMHEDAWTVAWRVLVHLQLMQTAMWTEWRHFITAWSFKRCRKYTDTYWSLKKKSANEYENDPQKEKLKTTNEEWKQN